jgi:mRNA-degrading endonuclease RelE of RelBE toxin-antitoxin system
MATVNITPAARLEFAALPRPIQGRVFEIFDRLQDWPAVSGAKPLRGELKGSFRIRTGDYRVIFRTSADGATVTVWKIGGRGGVYD